MWDIYGMWVAHGFVSAGMSKEHRTGEMKRVRRISGLVLGQLDMELINQFQ